MGAGEKCRCLPSDGSYWLTSYSKKRTAAGAPTDLSTFGRGRLVSTVIADLRRKA